MQEGWSAERRSTPSAPTGAGSKNHSAGLQAHIKILYKGKAPSNEGALQGVTVAARHWRCKTLWMLRLQAVARILYKGKAPSFEGALQGVTWRHAVVGPAGFGPAGCGSQRPVPYHLATAQYK